MLTTGLLPKSWPNNPAVKLIDYTGGSSFGEYLEGLKGKTVFTEKTGVNSIILDSCDELDKVAQNLAFSVSLYSGQMCTTPQNFFVPEHGVTVAGQQVPYEEVVRKQAAAITSLTQNTKGAPHVFGAIQSATTHERVQQLAFDGGRSVLAHGKVENP
jgi:acyl-CoA reductase-like NAD-dependent aldehyde dehydrogenase